MHDDLKTALDVLRNGGLILYPTDTIWAIGCDATNAEALKKIDTLKNTPHANRRVVLLDSTAKLQGYVNDIPEVAFDLADLTTKPLTIIYEDVKNLAPQALDSDGCIGIRITEEKFSKELCARFKKPILATSANLHTQETATLFSLIPDVIKQGVDYVVTYRQEEKQASAQSSILKLGKGGQITIIRD